MTKHNKLREKKKDKKRTRIITAAYELFLSKGFDSTTMDEIADLAEVSRSTLFRYFGSKEALVFPYQEERLDIFRLVLSSPKQGEPPFETVERAFMKSARVFWNAKEELKRQQKIISGSAFLRAREAAWYDHWESALTQFLVNPYSRDPDKARWAKMASSAIFAMVRVTMLEWFSRSCSWDLEQTASKDLKRIRKCIKALAPFLFEPGRNTDEDT